VALHNLLPRPIEGAVAAAVMDGVSPNSGITAMIAKRDRCPQGKKCANSPSRACRRRSDGLEPASSTEILRRYIASPRFNVAGECGFVGNAIVDSRDGGHFLRLYLNTGCMLRAESKNSFATISALLGRDDQLASESVDLG
jgi:hypothetical protein